MFVITTISNPAYYQKENNYFDYVYQDPKQMIRRELKYIPTPVLLLVEGQTIREALFPHDTLNYLHFVNEFAR